MTETASKEASVRSAVQKPDDLRGDRKIKARNVIVLDKQRTTLDFSVQTANEVDLLMKLTGSESMSDVIRSSLTMFSALDKMEARGDSMFIRDEDGSNALFIPSLRAVNGLLRSSCRTKKRRVTLELNARAANTLKALQQATGETKKTDVIRQAIHLHWTLLNEADQGRRVVVRDKNNEEYDMFEFDQTLKAMEAGA